MKNEEFLGAMEKAEIALYELGQVITLLERERDEALTTIERLENKIQELEDQLHEKDRHNA